VVGRVRGRTPSARTPPPASPQRWEKKRGGGPPPPPPSFFFPFFPRPPPPPPPLLPPPQHCSDGFLLLSSIRETSRLCPRCSCFLFCVLCARGLPPRTRRRKSNQLILRLLFCVWVPLVFVTCRLLFPCRLPPQLVCRGTNTHTRPLASGPLFVCFFGSPRNQCRASLVSGGVDHQPLMTISRSCDAYTYLAEYPRRACYDTGCNVFKTYFVIRTRMPIPP